MTTDGYIPERAKPWAHILTAAVLDGDVGVRRAVQNRGTGELEAIAKDIEKLTGKECRHVVLGHLQRAGHPTAFDRVFGTRLGVHAAKMVDRGEFGKMASLRGTDIVSVDMGIALATLKTVPKNRYDEARLFFGVEG